MTKGFTLIELLAVIVIIVILLLLIVPVVSNFMKTAEDKLYERQIENIRSGAKGWAAKNLSSLPTINGEFITIYLGELKYFSFIRKDIKNPLTGELFFDDMEIVIQREDDDYLYLVDPESGTGTSTFDSMAPSVLLKGQSNEQTEINEAYIDKGLIITDRFGKPINEYRTIIKSNSIIVDEVDTSRFAVYDITYQIDYPSGVNFEIKTIEITRTVEVVDTIAPVITAPVNTSIALENVVGFNAMSGIVVTDNSLEVLTVTVVGNLSAIPGVYVITYSATDSSGNSTTVLRNVEVFAPVWTFVVTIPAGSLNFAFAAVSSDLEIEWGDNSTTPFNGTGYPNHNYVAPGVYEVTLSGHATKISFCATSGTVCTSATPTKLTDIITTIPIELGLTDASAMFKDTTIATFSQINFFDEASANITDMSYMFAENIAFNHPIGNWDTASVNNIMGIFTNAASFNQPIGNWNVTNVTNMNSVFTGAEDFNQTIANWNTANVTDMRYMFYKAYAFNKPLTTWNVAKVINMYGMFRSATAFNQSLDGWVTTSVTQMYQMFRDATSFNQPVGHFNTSKVINMYQAFMGATSFNQALNTWNTATVTTMYEMFRGATVFDQPLSSWNTSNVTTMWNMFLSAPSFDQNISTWNTSKVDDMTGMFYGATTFNRNLSGWCVSLINAEQSNFRTNTPAWVLPKPIWGTCP